MLCLLSSYVCDGLNTVGTDGQVAWWELAFSTLYPSNLEMGLLCAAFGHQKVHKL